ncbi:hypothetical protein DXV75_10550 [Alteromonas aestuariivivens]|uniref:Sulfotransferase domain-containing protein n=1 Tax=Alteromonas aestuariivivens TaxID=1938339 RepID=A0A3D8M613_9ALTE|nr:hypothetical protein [Alteromonas aestuariivivens]RDV25061.1 hypothetical protein DXV75_10550 [Alteromonas aestuariivivens]
MKLFLHVGPHKTATTLIQKTMLDNQKVLLDNNLFYPSKFIRIFGHHDLINPIRNRQIHSEDISHLEKPEKNILLSSENLINLEEDDFEYLKNALSNFEINIIYCWRRATSKIFSIWQEIVKHGGTETFYQFSFPHLAKTSKSATLSADLKLLMLERVFGNASINIIDYDNSFINKDLIQQFLKTLGIKSELDIRIPYNDGTATNTALESHDVELIRALNVAFSKRKSIQGASVRRAFILNLKKLNSDNLNALRELIKSDKSEYYLESFDIDSRSEKIILDRFQKNITNYQCITNIKKISIPTQNWLIDPNGSKMFEKLYQELSAFL